MSDPIIHRPASGNRADALWFAALVIFLLLLTLNLYTLVHESGHALVGLLFGGKINDFSVNFFNLSAHVGIDGAFTPFQQALISVAGVSLPVLLCMLFLRLSLKPDDRILGWFRLLLFMSTVNSLLAWIAIPVLAMSGQTVSDDSFNFLNITHLPPLLVTGAALVVYLACWFVFLRSMGGVLAVVSLFRAPLPDLKQAQVQKTIRSLAALAAVTAGLTILLTLTFPDRGFQPPAGYLAAAEIRLSQGPLQDLPVYTFKLDRPASVSIFIGLDRVKGGPVQIRLTGPGGYENVFLDLQDTRADIGKGSVHPQALPLQPGGYEIRATFPPSSGQLRIYVKIE
jgi:hypothetical protein